MSKRFTDTEKWKKRFYRNLPTAYKLFWQYILDECDHAGIWAVDIEIFNFINKEDISREKALELFGNRIKVIDPDDNEKWFIPDFIKFQYGPLNPRNRLHESVICILEEHGLMDFYESYLLGNEKGFKPQASSQQAPDEPQASPVDAADKPLASPVVTLNKPQASSDQAPSLDLLSPLDTPSKDLNSSFDTPSKVLLSPLLGAKEKDKEKDKDKDKDRDIEQAKDKKEEKEKFKKEKEETALAETGKELLLKDRELKFDFCRMRESEYNMLLRTYGLELTTQAINILDNYCLSRGKTYKSYYRAILSWAMDEAKQRQAKQPQNKQNDYGESVRNYLSKSAHLAGQS